MESNLPGKLKERRKELGLTLLQIADRIGVTEATVQRWESGSVKNLRYDKIVSLAEVLHISPAVLMGWGDSPPVKISPPERDPLHVALDQLNADGREKVTVYAEDLVASGRYQK